MDLLVTSDIVALAFSAAWAELVMSFLVKSRCISRTFSVKSKILSTDSPASNCSTFVGTEAKASCTVFVQASTADITACWLCCTRSVYCLVTSLLMG